MDLRWGYGSKISLLGVEAPYQAIGVFYGALFPTVERQTEKRTGAQYAVDLEVFDVFSAVVIGDGSPEPLGKLAEATINGLACL